MYRNVVVTYRNYILILPGVSTHCVKVVSRYISISKYRAHIVVGPTRLCICVDKYTSAVVMYTKLPGPIRGLVINGCMYQYLHPINGET